MNPIELSLPLERIPDHALGIFHDHMVNKVLACMTQLDGDGRLDEERLLQLRKLKKAMYAVGRELKKREKSSPSLDILTP